jgi:hypothetical protein
MGTEVPDSFDCRATAAVLRSANSAAVAGHVAAVISALIIEKWSAKGSLLVWCVVVYLAIRVRMDALFFELLADHPAEQFDNWMKAAGLRKHTPPRAIQDRRRGALRLWRALLLAVGIEIALTLAGVLRLLP